MFLSSGWWHDILQSENEWWCVYVLISCGQGHRDTDALTSVDTVSHLICLFVCRHSSFLPPRPFIKTTNNNSSYYLLSSLGRLGGYTRKHQGVYVLLTRLFSFPPVSSVTSEGYRRGRKMTASSQFSSSMYREGMTTLNLTLSWTKKKNGANVPLNFKSILCRWMM